MAGRIDPFPLFSDKAGRPGVRCLKGWFGAFKKTVSGAATKISVESFKCNGSGNKSVAGCRCFYHRVLFQSDSVKAGTSAGRSIVENRFSRELDSLWRWPGKGAY